MRLWHRTDTHGLAGIRRHGFQQQDPPEGPAWDSEDRGFVWFAATKAIAMQTCWRSAAGGWVSIEVPDDMPETMLDHGTPHPGNYKLGIEFVNSLPLHFEEDE